MLRTTTVLLSVFVGLLLLAFARDSQAFSSSVFVSQQKRAPSNREWTFATRLYDGKTSGAVADGDATDEYETVTDVQEAVELLDIDADEKDTVAAENKKDDSPRVEVNNEMAYDDCDVSVSKEDLLSDVQELINAEPLVLVNEEDEEDRGISIVNGLMSDISRKLSFLKPEPDEPEEITDMDAAQISSSLYMNPATEKIAQNVKITWEPQVAETLGRMEQVSNPNRPFMVGIVGIPGSGKSTSAEIIQAILGEDRCIIMPMDGFHIPLAELAEMENAADVIYRRGAPDTFHAAALQEELHKIAYGGSEKQHAKVTFPGFDHSVGDPTPDQHVFTRASHRIVLCEGLYLLHDDDGWENIKSIFDWTIYIDANVDVCIERLKERNKCIPGYTPEEIEIRCDAVDRVNAELAKTGAYKYASQIVSSGASS